MRIKDDCASNAIYYNNESYGPAFGYKGGDLRILQCGNKDKFECFVSDIGENYEIPGSRMANPASLVGKMPYNQFPLPISEIEVFELMKQDEWWT